MSNNNVDAMGVGFGDIDDNPHRNTIEAFRIDNTDTLRNLDLELRGYEQDPINKVWVKPDKKTNSNLFGMSDKCRKFIVGAFSKVMTKSNVQGALLKKYNGDKEYEWKCKLYSEEFENTLMYNMDEYNINLKEISFLSTQFEETVRTFFTRILDDGERNRERPTETFIHKDDMNSDDKKLGLGV